MLKAVILAGGRGERLKPLTDAMPKPMVMISGRPFLEHQLQLLKKNKISEILLCVGYLGDTITAYFGNGSSFGLKIEYSKEEELLGTAGALKQAAGWIPKDFLLLYGDSYLPIDYSRLANTWGACDCSGLVVCYDNSSRIDRNNVYLLPDGNIGAYNKRQPDPRANYVEAGVSVLKKEILDLVPADKQVSLEEEVFPILIKEKRLRGYPVSQRYYDIGTPQRLVEIEGVLQ